MTYKNHRLRSIFTCITKRDFLKLKEYFMVKPDEINIVIDEKSGYTPLLFTIKTDYPEAALFLISKGADVNQKDIHIVCLAVSISVYNSQELANLRFEAPSMTSSTLGSLSSNGFRPGCFHWCSATVTVLAHWNSHLAPYPTHPTPPAKQR
jgi:hypothetical protein